MLYLPEYSAEALFHHARYISSKKVSQNIDIYLLRKIVLGDIYKSMLLFVRCSKIILLTVAVYLEHLTSTLYLKIRH
ncbi:hypothetical protein HDC92_001623 [Pedobacter sp. AK017]|nr:hypothetical protein [Pedobacter sp. AK017]